MNHTIKYNDKFYNTFKIDGHVIDLEYNCTSVIKIWYQYNNNKNMTYLFYDLENKTFTGGNIDRLFTSRQKKMLLKKLQVFSKKIILDFINNIYNNNFTLTDENIFQIEKMKRKMSII